MTARLQVYADGAGRWRWRHIAGNGRIDNASEQGYRWRSYATWKAKRAYPGVTVI